MGNKFSLSVRVLLDVPGLGAGGQVRPPVTASRLAGPGRYTRPLVYAVIKTGGKQERVEEGQRLAVELLATPTGEDVSFSPVLVVDGTDVLATPGELAGAEVSARVVGGELGPKVRGFVYKPKTRSRRSWGHRQRYSTIEVTAITMGAAKTGAAKTGAAETGAAETGADRASKEEA
ncbi:MAG: 50S ribosomal protein L21 [Acidimicrobiales bacterium]